jgi:hypothetical protein
VIRKYALPNIQEGQFFSAWTQALLFSMFCLKIKPLTKPSMHDRRRTSPYSSGLKTLVMTTATNGLSTYARPFPLR